MWGRATERLGITLDQLLEMVAAGNVRQRPLTVAELAEVAVFLASDRASGMTATVANVSCGSVVVLGVAGHRMEVGAGADLVLLDGSSVREALTRHSPPRYVIASPLLPELSSTHSG